MNFLDFINPASWLKPVRLLKVISKILPAHSGVRFNYAVDLLVLLISALGINAFLELKDIDPTVNVVAIISGTVTIATIFIGLCFLSVYAFIFASKILKTLQIRLKDGN